MSLAFAPGAKELWSAAQYGHIELSDWMSGNAVRSLERVGAGHDYLALSPDGCWLAAGKDVWDLNTGARVRYGPDTDVPLSISPDGRLLASGDESAVTIWEFMTQKEIHRFKLDTGRVKALAFSPDGTALVSSDYNDALVWDMTGRLEDGRLVSASLSRAAMESLWQSLAGDDSWAAYRAPGAGRAGARCARPCSASPPCARGCGSCGPCRRSRALPPGGSTTSRRWRTCSPCGSRTSPRRGSGRAKPSWIRSRKLRPRPR